MPKKRGGKPKDAEDDPFGPGFAEFSTEAFKEAVEEVRERLEKKGLDCYGAVDGKRAARKPDGRIVFLPEKKKNG